MLVLKKFLKHFVFLCLYLSVYLALCLVPFMGRPTFREETLPSNGAQLLNQFKLGNKAGFQYQQLLTRTIPASKQSYKKPKYK